MYDNAKTGISMILDEGSFAELGGYARAQDDAGEASDGIKTGFGRIGGKTVFVFSQDPDVMKGSMGAVHASKIERLYELALKTGSPVIGFFDSAGLRLGEGPEALASLGRVCAAAANASGVILQIAVISGNCGGGMSVIPQLFDLCFFEKDRARLFFNAPDALTGEKDGLYKAASAEAALESGQVDMAGSREEIADALRKLIGILPSNYEDLEEYGECADDPNRLCAGIASLRYDADKLAAMIADNGEYFEVRRGFGPETMAAFLQINGLTCGVIAHRGVQEEERGALLSPEGLKKAAAFADLCDAFSIPIISLVNTDGFERSAGAEKELALAASCFVQAYANASVPKISVIAGDSFGSAVVFSGSKGLGADLVLAWDDVKTGVMKGKYAAQITAQGQDAENIASEAGAYDLLKNDIRTAAEHNFVDIVIRPEETRRYLAGILDMLSSKGE